MPRKATRTKKNDAEGKGAKSAVPGPPMVTVLVEAQAEKLSPRGDGKLTYQVGRRNDTVYIRLYKNESSGRMSTEFVPVAALRDALSGVKAGQPFKASLLAQAWKGRSSTNAGFGAAVLAHLQVLKKDPEKRGMLLLTGPGALDDWEKSVLAMDVPDGAERVPLNPPKPKPPFAKKDDGEEEAAEVGDDADGGEECDGAGSEA